MNSASRFAFLAFLDLISCAFGAAVLIFVVAAVAGEPEAGSEQPDMLVVRAKHLGGAQPETGLKIDHRSISYFTTNLRDLNALNARVFSSPAGTGSVFCLLIPEPSDGDWVFTPYRVDGFAASASSFDVDMFCPQIAPRDKPKTCTLLPSKVLSPDSVQVTIAK